MVKSYLGEKCTGHLESFIAWRSSLTLAEKTLSGHVFVFPGRCGNVVKATSDGVRLLSKRFEPGRLISRPAAARPI